MKENIFNPSETSNKNRYYWPTVWQCLSNQVQQKTLDCLVTIWGALSLVEPWRRPSEDKDKWACWHDVCHCNQHSHPKYCSTPCVHYVCWPQELFPPRSACWCQSYWDSGSDGASVSAWKTETAASRRSSVEGKYTIKKGCGEERVSATWQTIYQ